MNKIKNGFHSFWYIFKNSLFVPSYYAQLKTVKINFSIKFLSIFILIASFVASLFTSIVLSRDLASRAGGYIDELRASFPSDLEVNFSNSTWEINKETPFAVAMPQSIKEFLGQSSWENLVIFDKKGIVTDLSDKKSLMLVNENNLLMDNNGQVQTTPLSQMPSGKLDYKTFSDQLDKLTGLLKYVPLVIFPFSVAAGIVNLFLLSLFVGGVAILVLSVGLMIFKIGTDFGNTTKMAMHSLVFPITFQTVLSCLYVILGEKLMTIPAEYVGGFMLIAYLGFLGMILRMLKILSSRQGGTPE